MEAGCDSTAVQGCWRCTVLEPRLGNHDDVAGLHREIGSHVTLVEQICQAQVIGLQAGAGSPHQFCPIASRKLGQPTCLDHDIQETEFVAVGERLWFDGLADHTDLIVEITDKLGDRDGRHRLFQIGAEGLLEVSGQLGWKSCRPPACPRPGAY